MTIMVIQCGCLDMMWAEDRKILSQLEWPNTKSYVFYDFKSLKSDVHANKLMHTGTDHR